MPMPDLVNFCVYLSTSLYPWLIVLKGLLADMMENTINLVPKVVALDALLCFPHLWQWQVAVFLKVN